MAQAESGIFVLSIPPAIHIRVNGRGSFQNSQPLRLFAADMIDCGNRQFVIDLGPCTGMDSTFLGVLTGIGLSLGRQQPPGTVHIVNASSHSLELLKSLWLDRLFHISDSKTQPPDALPPPPADFRELPNSDPAGNPRALPRSETREMVLTAHEDLIRADARNKPEFAAVTKLLREEKT